MKFSSLFWDERKLQSVLVTWKQTIYTAFPTHSNVLGIDNGFNPTHGEPGVLQPWRISENGRFAPFLAAIASYFDHRR
ncbi:hypothetical protein TNCV_3991861 [Trichonephila clavipes]|uniref:Uncharacterized protein n=1 Tax=Trichonephila clavipes TaxID=2585209 RepID=A0A8X6VJK5_TRICX|nr:hypothetical protein TNCV_3991861 [Trichonephila clavipes]